MSRPLLIGLTGCAGSGKDSVGDVLSAAGWLCIAFADALRLEVCTAWHTPIATFTERRSKELATPCLAAEWCDSAGFLHWCAVQEISLHEPRSPRWVMQAWGAWRRSLDPLYWVRFVDTWVGFQTMRLGPPPGLVITDVRQANEAAMVGRRGGHVVRVHRPGLPPLPADTAHHVSEIEAAAIMADAEIHNAGDLQHLAAETHRVLQRLRDRREALIRSASEVAS